MNIAVCTGVLLKFAYTRRTCSFTKLIKTNEIVKGRN